MKKYYDITGFDVERQTEKAMLINGAWLPKSQIKIFTNGKGCIKFIPLWLASKNNFPYELHTYELKEMVYRYTGDNETYTEISG